MKLTKKLYFHFIACLLIVLTLYGYFSYKRESNEIRTHALHDLANLGQALSRAAKDVWQTSGEERALWVIGELDTDTSKIAVQWVWLTDNDGKRLASRLSSKEFKLLIYGNYVIKRGTRTDGTEALLAYFPTVIEEARLGAIELSEPLEYFQNKIILNAIHLAITTLLIMIVAAVVMFTQGRQLLGKRLNALTEFSRAIGKGNLEEELTLGGNDEITELADKMNDMAHDLRKSRQDLVAETKARIETLEQLRLTDRLTAMGKLSSVVAHELGTPLNVVTGRAQIIAREELSREELVENATIIKDQAHRMTAIVRQILNYARRNEPRRVKTNLYPLIIQTFDMFAAKAKEQGVKFVIPENVELPDIEIDPSQIQQVMTNLVGNGIQAMPQGGRLTVEIDQVRCKPPGRSECPEAEYIEISFCDQGAGIDPGQLEHIFEPFFTTKGTGKGTGLGLAIAQGIIMEHDGWIEVQSEVNKGTCFTFYLPLETSECTDEYS